MPHPTPYPSKITWKWEEIVSDGEAYRLPKFTHAKFFKRKREIVAVFKTCVSVERNVTAAREKNVSASAAVPYMYDRWPCLQRENKGNTWWRRTVA